ncbi:coiled-coil-helix-coiled-coil-helix domain-containing protein 7 isoform X6 [Epinephelus moara]|uniref:coiled-coil-helix-coiled-coil-helix domain-containing protein 7 isoform X6 n=1 Tax=Epinephelus moara TaxID=300413 RepID=UPI00214F58BE|nr:coiled-coil-helix-coiled-coil-helix domain-containing protein 7 isoform X6 [Epinephelus moara]
MSAPRTRSDKVSDINLQEEFKAIREGMASMQAALELQLDKKVDTLRDTMMKLAHDNMESMKKQMEKITKEIRESLDVEVGVLSARMDAIELKIEKNKTSKKLRFDPDVSIIVSGLSSVNNEDATEKVRELLAAGLRCDPMPELVAVERLRPRGPGPGIIKVEFRTVEEKVAALRLKHLLRENRSFERVYIRSAKSHADRLIELNFRTLLRELPTVGKDFYITGRMMKRSPVDADAYSKNK